MQLPTPLSRRDKNVHKSSFGHDLILAGSRNMLGALALCGLAAMRTGAGLVTLGVPESLNVALQNKISSVLMTLPLKETNQQTISPAAYQQLKDSFADFNAIAIGPGLSLNPRTQKFIIRVIETVTQPLVIDADALNALSKNLKSLTKTKTVKILTPHPGEMARLLSLKKDVIENNRKIIAHEFAKKYNCILLLKGYNTVIAAPDGRMYINRTGNPGMATAGSGDVLTGMITAYLGQGVEAFDAARLAAYMHGKAGDLAAKNKTKIAMIATDIIDNIPNVLKGNK